MSDKWAARLFMVGVFAFMALTSWLGERGGLFGIMGWFGY